MLSARIAVRYLAIRANGGHFEKPLVTAEQAVKSIPSGATILLGGFGLCGTPEKSIIALARSNVRRLHIVSNDAGTPTFGIGLLMRNGQIRQLTASYVGENDLAAQQYFSGKLELELVPQGTLAESLRSGGAGIPFFYTKSGAGTIYAKGQLVRKYLEGGGSLVSETKETLNHNGQLFVREPSRTGDFALIKAWKADYFGNLVFRETARNFNPVMAKAAARTIVEVEELVPTGSIDPDEVHLPGIYVDQIIHGGRYEKMVAHLTVDRMGPSKPWSADGANISEARVVRDKIARRAAREFTEGMYVNLGIGMAEHSSNFIPKGMTVHIDSENGVLGLGPLPRLEEVDPDLINAGKEAVTVFSGASYFGSDESFDMIRGGHFDMSMMGAFEVSQKGDLANWIIPGKVVKGMGGAMDLATSGSRIVITMAHLSKSGKPKIVAECSLPLTAHECVSRIITDLAVFDVVNGKLWLMEIASGVTVEEVKGKTGGSFAVSSELKSDSY